MTQPNPSESVGRPHASEPSGAAAPAVQRQFVNFAFYKLDPAFRRLNDHEKIQARSEFLELFQTPASRADLPDLQHRRPPARVPISCSGGSAASPDDFQAQHAGDQQDAARRLPDARRTRSCR